MRMMRGTGWTEETLMEAVSLWSLPEGYNPIFLWKNLLSFGFSLLTIFHLILFCCRHLVVPVNFPRAEALLQGVVVASTVVLKDTGLEIALLVTGRTNVIDVEIGVTSRGTARTVLRSSGTVWQSHVAPFLAWQFLEVLVWWFYFDCISGGTQVTQGRRLGLGLGLLLVAEEEAPAEAIAVTVVTGIMMSQYHI